MFLKKYKNLPNRIAVGNNKYIGEGDPAFFIAEIGNNHNGDYFLAKKTMEEAVKSGADAVKFQKRFIEEVFAKELREKLQTKDQVLGKTYGEYRQALELDFEEFVKLKSVSQELGTIFFATPFDKKSVDFLEKVGVDLYKIASFDTTNLPLLEYVAQKGKPVILSTGMTSLEELDSAVETILRYNKQLIILHCVSVYPSVDERLSLLTIPFLKERYSPLPIGYSGHERDYSPTLAAVTLGAKCIERHFTLDKNLPGPDHATVSVDPEQFTKMVHGAKRIEVALGTPGKYLFEEEMATRNKHSKSLVAKIDIPAGALIRADMLTCKSPGYGLKPRMLPQVIGKKAKKDILADTVLTNDHIILEA
ncbi:MAG: N-acetylneuraminate synthase family protein [Patescibacteria group bacterium]